MVLATVTTGQTDFTSCSYARRC